MFILPRRGDKILFLWRRPARSSSTKLSLLYRGQAPDTKPWVEGFQSLQPTLILAQGILALTKSGFTLNHKEVFLLGSVSLSVCAQDQAGEE